MDEPVTPEDRTHAKVVAIARLRKLKQALEGKQARLSPAERLSISRVDGEEFQRSVQELRRVGINIPHLTSNRDVDQGDGAAASVQQLLTQIDLVLDQIAAKPGDPPARDS